MSSKTIAGKPEAARAAEIVREYGPFAGAEQGGHGVSTTAAASGPPPARSWSPSTPPAARPTRTLDCACDAGTAFDGKHLYQIAESRIDKIDPATGKVLASIPAPGSGGDSGLTWAEGSLWVGQYRGRKIHQIDPATGADQAHHRVEPLRHRRHLGRRRAVARHLGRRRERAAPHRPAKRRRARAAGDAGRHLRQRPRVRRRRPLLLRRRRQRQGARRAAPKRPLISIHAGTRDRPRSGRRMGH
jgi:hypothetical protein